MDAAPGWRHNLEGMGTDPMKAAIAGAWNEINTVVETQCELVPPRECSSDMCNNPAVICSARETGGALTPLDEFLCASCAQWEVERTFWSPGWAGRDPRIYLAYVLAGLCVCVDTGDDGPPPRAADARARGDRGATTTRPGLCRSFWTPWSPHADTHVARPPGALLQGPGSPIRALMTPSVTGVSPKAPDARRFRP